MRVRVRIGIGMVLAVGLGRPATGAPPPIYGGVLDLVSADSTFGFAQERLEALTREPLFRIDARGKLEPVLARGPLEAVGDELHLVLREDVVLHDGRTLDASAVAAWLESLAKPGARRGHLVLPLVGARLRLAGQTARLGVRVVDRHRLALRLAHPFPDLERLWAGPRAGLEISARGGASASGPFALNPRHPLELRAFSRHRDGRPFLDRVELRRRPTASGGDREEGFDRRWQLGTGTERCSDWALFVALIVKGPGRARARIDPLIGRSRVAERFLPAGSVPVRRFFGGAETPPRVPRRELSATLVPGFSSGAPALAKRLQLDLTRGGIATAIAPVPRPGPDGRAGLVLELTVLPLRMSTRPIDRLAVLMGLAARLGRAEAIPAERLVSLAGAPKWRHAVLVDRLEAELRDRLGLVPLARVPISGQRPAGLSEPGSPCDLAVANLSLPLRAD